MTTTPLRGKRGQVHYTKPLTKTMSLSMGEN
jgi:hypothetical protein